MAAFAYVYVGLLVVVAVSALVSSCLRTWRRDDANHGLPPPEGVINFRPGRRP